MRPSAEGVKVQEARKCLQKAGGFKYTYVLSGTEQGLYLNLSGINGLGGMNDNNRFLQ